MKTTNAGGTVIDEPKSRETVKPAVDKRAASTPAAKTSQIYVDGKFIGGTPATISLATGTHQITMKAVGKKDWTREINVLKGS